jgi:hypothetical protein
MTGNAGVSELLLILFLATPISIAIYLFWVAWTRADPQQDTISVQYDPPNNLTPGECGALVDNAIALRCITATITDLSVQGYLTIEQKELTDATGNHTDYVFHLRKPLTELGKLKPHEREVMTSLFTSTNPLLMLSLAVKGLEQAHVASGNKMADSIGNKMLSSMLSGVEAQAKEASDQYQAMSGTSDGVLESVALSDLQQAQFSMRLPRIRDAVFNRLVAEGYYASRPDWIRIKYGVSGVFLGLAMAVAGGFLASMTKIAPLALIGIGAFTGAIVLGFGFFLPARTRAGTQLLAKVLGFREFLVRVEKDQIERLEKTPELFEKYLPYAMALAVENRWTQTFGNITVPPPKWYQGKRRDGFLPMHLTNDLNQMSMQATGASTLSSVSSGPAGESPNSVAS